MVDILVRPPELRQISEQLRSSAKKIGMALQAIDNDILSLKGDQFLGNRANSVQAHYAPKRDALLKAQEIVFHFSGDLTIAADEFEKADRSGGSYHFYEQPGGFDWGEFGKDEVKNGAAVVIGILDKIGQLPFLPAPVYKFIKNLLEGLLFNNEDALHALLSAGINVGMSELIKYGLKAVFGNIMLVSGGVQIIGNLVAAVLEMTGQHQTASLLQNSLNVIDLGGYINDIAEGITDWMINPSHPNPFGRVIERISKIGEVANALLPPARSDNLITTSI
jgi:uncharacterized protein YukE